MPEHDSSIAQVDEYLSKNADRFVDELCELLRIPSVSAEPKHAGDVRRAAEYVRQQLIQAGVPAEICETAGHPIVRGSLQQAPGAPTVLVYGHYDVQPADPHNEWITPAFEPNIRDGYVYARGATDDKGQMLTHVKSVEAWLKTVGKLPVNVHFVIEGEEEVGSRNLEEFLETHRRELACDVAVVSDTSQYGPEMPAITYGLRGIMACEVTVTGPSQDLHSGVFGGSVANPINGLAKMIAALHDERGRVRIPGFYDDIVPLAGDERKQLAALPFDERQYLKELGTSAVWGEDGFTTTERRWARPTCDVNGITGGYQGEGPKTIVPSRATAKITCRLVPNQDPEKLIKSLEDYLRANLLPGLTMKFTTYHGAGGLVFSFDSPQMEAAKKAIEQAFGKPPVMIREGGSIPVVATFRDVLGVTTLLLGWGQNTDNLHSPNEHFRLADFHRGIRASAHLWRELANVK